MIPRFKAAFALAAGLAALPASQAAADCNKLAGEVRKAIADGATARYGTLFAAVGADRTCNPRYRAQVGRSMARSLLTSLPVGSEPAAIAAALRFGRPWQVLVALGDAYYDRQDWGGAGDAYREALTDMSDPVANPTPPPDKIVERVQRRALQSGTLVPAAGDLFASRGFGAEAPRGPAVIAFFPAGSSDLGEVGRAGLRAAFPAIRKAAPKSLFLIGHAAPDEDPALGEARAQAVATYLDALGYAGRITTSASSQRFAADEPDKLTSDQAERLERRVEYVPGR